MKLSKLEESICLLNETLCSSNGERGNIAMHSFRSALKVAALATGKLILPNESTTKKVTSSPKRPRIGKEDMNDAWNVKYLHTNPLLHSRDRFVDALSFHTAALRYPQSRELFIDKREICFDEALTWRTRQVLPTLNKEWMIWIMDVQAMYGKFDIVYTVGNSFKPQVPYIDEQKKKTSLHALELLASSSASQFACDC